MFWLIGPVVKEMSFKIFLFLILVAILFGGVDCFVHFGGGDCEEPFC